METNKGFIKMIIVIIIALIILGYFFNIRITDILNSANVQSNLSWFWGLIVKIWNFISYPFMFIWNRYVA